MTGNVLIRPKGYRLWLDNWLGGRDRANDTRELHVLDKPMGA